MAALLGGGAPDLAGLFGAGAGGGANILSMLGGAGGAGAGRLTSLLHLPNKNIIKYRYSLQKQIQ